MKKIIKGLPALTVLLSVCLFLTACNIAGIPNGKYYEISAGDLNMENYIEINGNEVKYTKGKTTEIFNTVSETENNETIYKLEPEDSKGSSFTYNIIIKWERDRTTVEIAWDGTNRTAYRKK